MIQIKNNQFFLNQCINPVLIKNYMTKTERQKIKK